MTNPEETQNPLSFSGLIFEPRPQELSWNRLSETMNNQGNQYQGFQGEIPALPVFQTEVAQETLQPPPVVIDTGNPRVFPAVPGPVPDDTHTREGRVRVFPGRGTGYKGYAGSENPCAGYLL